jgi:MscS family membrane protein
MQEMLSIKVMNREVWRYIAMFGIVLAALISRILFSYIMRKKVMKLAGKTKTEIDDRLVDAATPPIANFIYIAALYFIFQVAMPEGKTVRYSHVALNLLIGINIAYFAFRFIHVFELYLLKMAARTDNALDDQFVGTMKKALKILVVIISAIVIADNLGYNVSGLIAGLGIGGLAIALAAQDSLANIFGSITVIFDKPFQVNERIKVMGHDGIIEKIGLRSTRLRTLDGHLVTIPNKELTNTAVENVALRPSIKFITTIGVVYSTTSEKLRKGVQIIKDVLKDADHVQDDYRVYFKTFNDYSLDIFIIYWVKPADYWLSLETTEKINFAIKEAFEKEEIEMAFPTQTVEISKG